jgi:hypothetical protein
MKFSIHYLIRKSCYCLFFSALVGLTSCSRTIKVSSSKLVGLKNSYCTPNVAYQSSADLWNDPRFVDLSKTKLNAHDQLMCKILGISGQVDKLINRSNKKADSLTLERLALLQSINGRIRIAQTELQAIAAELDCEGERADMAGAYLENLDDKRDRNFTVASVIVAALTTVATVVVSGDGAQTAIGVGGGLISAGLGAVTINPRAHQFEFLHERNLLRSIWVETDENADYPGFVWRMLNEKQFSNKGDKTLAQSIKNRWTEFEFDGETNGNKQNLIFGSGGIYRADDFQTRSSMINQMQSTIRSINQDLTSLVVYIESL